MTWSPLKCFQRVGQADDRAESGILSPVSRDEIGGRSFFRKLLPQGDR
jgi:hypothetical protein